MELFESKIRKVGSSIGLLVPKGVVMEDNLKAGEAVQVALIKRDKALIESAFGSAKGRSFKRVDLDRVF